ncbi:MAG: hypothetical protein HQM08_29380 [Candidatus Riflebacteria bacterium]|nr:hypothetical protein [Candidatus Riflebacteria bacterium]
MNRKILPLIFVFALLPISLFALEDASSIIKDYPMYKELEQDAQISRQFEQYMQWLSDKAPDGAMVYDLMKNKIGTVDAISTIFHEKVEFYGWLTLGHKYEDIMNPEYYRNHYMEVYPIAHRKAVIDEINLIKYFAQKKGFPNIPEVAYNLVSPLLERRGATAAQMQNRLKYNLEYQPQVLFVTDADLETAVKIYEQGGYKYVDREKILSEAKTFVSNSKK